MADSSDLIKKYLADMQSIEAHIYQAIDKQVKGTADKEPAVSAMLSGYRDTLDAHQKGLAARLEALGGSATHPIKELGASVLGIGAGLVDGIRSEATSKALRDDYTAINLSVVSYVMLHTTAVAVGDNETADLVKPYIVDNAKFVMELQQAIPQAVYNDLGDDYGDLNSAAVPATKDAISEVWGQARQEERSGS